MSRSSHIASAKVRCLRNSTARLDDRILQSVRVGDTASAAVSMKALSTIGEHSSVWVSLMAMLAIGDRRRRSAWAFAACLGPLSILGNLVVKKVVRRERPRALESPTSLSGRISYSFPSAHATSSFAVATVAGRIDRRAQKPTLVMASAIAYSRVYLGRHYPTDVVAGGVLGTVGGVAASRVLPMLKRRSQA